MLFKNPNDGDKWLSERQESTVSMRRVCKSSFGRDRCYFEGLHWLPRYGFPMNWKNTTTGRVYGAGPDDPNLRVTVNRTTKFIVKSASATHPSDIYVECTPSDFDSSTNGAAGAQLCEDMTNMVIEDSKYLMARREANFDRCIVGCVGVSLHIKTCSYPLAMNGKTIVMQAKKLEARTFDASNLILDPAFTGRDLRQHDEIIFQAAWPAAKIRRDLGIPLDDAELRTLGELRQEELDFASYTGGRVYAPYLKLSKTLGAFVYQIHRRDNTGRFGEYYVVVETGKQPRKWINFDDPITPFGGDGLPLILLHGHQRPQSPYSIGDVAMTRDDQDKLNLLASLNYRTVQVNSGYQIPVDKRLFPRGTSDEEIAQKFTNRVGGIIPVDYGNPQEGKRDIKPIVFPPPNPTVLDMMDRAESDMRNQTFHAEGDFGVTKTHVTADANRENLRRGDSVSDVRMKDDLEQDENLLTVMLGTTIKLVQEGGPYIAQMLVQRGFGVEDIAAMLKMDPEHPPCSLRVRESTVRHRPPEDRRQDLNNALQLQAITPSRYLQAMADELDLPVTDSDRAQIQNLRKIVLQVAQGQPWIPLPLGQYSDWAIDLMRRELVNARRENNIKAVELLSQGIQMQTQASLQEQMQSNPELALKAQEQSQPQQPEQPRQQPPQNIGELLDQVTAGAPS